MSDRDGGNETGKAASESSFLQLGKGFAVLVAITTPFCYLNGRAFHDGYLAGLGLAPSMFPSDVQGTFIEAARAWMESSAVVLRAVASGLLNHGMPVVCAALLLTVALSFIIYGRRRPLGSTRSAPSDVPQASRRYRAVQSFVVAAYAVFLGSYLLYTLFAVVGTALMLAIGPFQQVGARVAAKDLARGFPSAPTVELASPHGQRVYRVIECAEKFCALYADGKVAAVPLSAITWADAYPAGLPAHDRVAAQN